MDRLPKVFVNKINKRIDNEQMVYKDDIKKELRQVNKKDIYYLIEAIFADKEHIYKSRVKIIFKDGEKECDVVGKTSDSLLTLNNELIKIKDIVDIYKV